MSRVDLEGLCNFRDLGGYPTTDDRVVRHGRLYRSDALHRMTPADVDTVCLLEIATVIDLHTPDEVAHVGTGLIDDLGATYRNLPTRPAVLTEAVDDGPPASAAEHYFGYLNEGRTCFGGVVETLADPAAFPAVFFCNAGKDRTGAVAAMVLGLLGVDDETVAADYARTQEVLEAIGAATSRDYPTDVKAWRNLSPDMRTARAETMLEFLHLVRERVGGWHDYVLSLGVEPAAIAAMQANLVSEDRDMTTGEIDPQALRRLDLEGPVNFRDLGGYETADGRTVRRRHLFRSDALFRLTESDAAQVSALGVTTLIDFRTPDELEEHGLGGMDHLDAEHLHLPTIDTTRRVLDLTDEVTDEIAQALVTAADAYMMMLDRGSNAYASALRVVAGSEAPVVFFCAAGKDRTGVFAALVLGLLGVSDEDIVTDYALTHDVIEKIHILRTSSASDAANASAASYAHLIGEDLRNAYPASMQTTIERLRERYGDWVGYATEIGVGADVLEQLRARLLV